MPVSASMKDVFEICTLLAGEMEKCAVALAPTYAELPYHRDVSIDDASSFPNRALQQEARGCLVAVVESNFVGGLFAAALADDGAILNVTELIVVPQWRRRGVARALVRELCRQWPNAEKNALLIHRQAPTYEVYSRMGFVELERLAPMVWTR